MQEYHKLTIYVKGLNKTFKVFHFSIVSLSLTSGTAQVHRLESIKLNDLPFL